MKKKNTRRILLGLIFVLAAMQFIQPQKTNPTDPAESDFASVYDLEAVDVELINKACYDCHSNETVWPWYADVAPASYVIVNHVNEGRKHLNFSKWGSYSSDRKDHKLEECSEEVESGEMPMSSYILAHKEARITAEERARLVELFRSLR